MFNKILVLWHDQKISSKIAFIQCHLTISCSLFKICQKYTHIENRWFVTAWKKAWPTVLLVAYLPQKVWHIYSMLLKKLHREETCSANILFATSSSSDYWGYLSQKHTVWREGGYSSNWNSYDWPSTALCGYAYHQSFQKFWKVKD